MKRPITIELTPEMEEKAAAFSLALRLMVEATTETAAKAWLSTAERHRTELAMMVFSTIRPPPESAVQLFERLSRENGVELFVEVEEEEPPCAE